jgi:hypothetical protein
LRQLDEKSDVAARYITASVSGFQVRPQHLEQRLPPGSPEAPCLQVRQPVFDVFRSQLRQLALAQRGRHDV